MQTQNINQKKCHWPILKQWKNTQREKSTIALMALFSWYRSFIFVNSHSIIFANIFYWSILFPADLWETDILNTLTLFMLYKEVFFFFLSVKVNQNYIGEGYQLVWWKYFFLDSHLLFSFEHGFFIGFLMLMFNLLHHSSFAFILFRKAFLILTWNNYFSCLSSIFRIFFRLNILINLKVILVYVVR